jgi:hypothetical protein
MGSLQALIDAVPDGGTLVVPRGVYEGQVRIVRAITLQAVGCRLVGGGDPVLVVDAANVKLRGLVIGAGGSHCALDVRERSGLVLRDVIVDGVVRGLPAEEGEWDLPKRATFGRVGVKRAHEMTLTLRVPVHVWLSASSDAVSVVPSELDAGTHAVTLRLEASSVPMIIDGVVRIATSHVRREFPLTADVIVEAPVAAAPTPPVVAAPPSPAVTVTPPPASRPAVPPAVSPPQAAPAQPVPPQAPTPRTAPADVPAPAPAASSAPTGFEPPPPVITLDPRWRVAPMPAIVPAPPPVDLRATAAVPASPATPNGNPLEGVVLGRDGRAPASIAELLDAHRRVPAVVALAIDQGLVTRWLVDVANLPDMAVRFERLRNRFADRSHVMTLALPLMLNPTQPVAWDALEITRTNDGRLPWLRKALYSATDRRDRTAAEQIRGAFDHELVDVVGEVFDDARLLALARAWRDAFVELTHAYADRPAPRPVVTDVDVAQLGRIVFDDDYRTRVLQRFATELSSDAPPEALVLALNAGVPDTRSTAPTAGGTSGMREAPAAREERAATGLPAPTATTTAVEPTRETPPLRWGDDDPLPPARNTSGNRSYRGFLLTVLIALMAVVVWVQWQLEEPWTRAVADAAARVGTPAPAAPTATRPPTNATPLASNNITFATAAGLAGASGRVVGRNVNAVTEPNEPRHANSGTASLWYGWTAPRDGTVEFHTAGSSFDTVLAVYRGASLATLTEVASNDDDASGLTSRVPFRASVGVRYWIAVAGYAGARGNVTLSWSMR